MGSWWWAIGTRTFRTRTMAWTAAATSTRTVTCRCGWFRLRYSRYRHGRTLCITPRWTSSINGCSTPIAPGHFFEFTIFSMALRFSPFIKYSQDVMALIVPNIGYRIQKRVDEIFSLLFFTTAKYHVSISVSCINKRFKQKESRKKWYENRCGM